MTQQKISYFAYGSNMSLARLTARVPSAVSLGCHRLPAHDLRFHKVGADGSGKCDAYATGAGDDVIYGVLFQICMAEKLVLDRIEGLGFGYQETTVSVFDHRERPVKATTYTALKIDRYLDPYTWYRDHVLIGAREASLPTDYITRKILSNRGVADPDMTRELAERAVHRAGPSG